jgi:prophage tail gpP-like protein
LFNGGLVCRGYVDRYQPHIREHGEAEISVSGRSKAQDMVDSSAFHETGYFKNKTPAEIAQELDRFGVGISTDEQLEKFRRIRSRRAKPPFVASRSFAARTACGRLASPTVRC